MSLKEHIPKYPSFMRGFGKNKVIVTLLNFDWEKDYDSYRDGRSHTEYFIIPCFFPKQDGITKDITGGLKLSKTCLKTLQNALQGYDDKPCNHTLIGCYDDKTKSYDIKRMEGNFVDTKRNIKGITQR